MGNESRIDGRNEARERFFSLLADELADERTLDDDERRFQERSASEDSECRAFSAVLQELRRPEPVAPAEIDRALLAHGLASRDSRRRGIVAFAMTTAAAAAVALVVFAMTSREPAERSSSQHGNGPAFFMAAESGRPATAGHVFTTASAPLLLRSDDDVSVGLDRSSSIEVAALDEEAVSLRLTRGRVAIHLVPGGPRRVRVITPLCEVEVTGTVFSVAVEPAEVRVGVVRGSVAISNAAQGEIARVIAGQSFSVHARDTKPLEAHAAGAILALLRMEDARSGTAAGTTAAGVQATLSGAPSQAPDAGASPIQRQGADALGKNGKGAASTSSAAKAPVETPADLIRRARERVKVQEWAEAVALYRQIARDFPGRQEAVTVRVPLAEIELDHLGSPGTALTDYRYYLATAPAGPLTEDAMYGVCTALKRLGRIEDEAKSLSEFQRRFPQSLHAQAAKVRLEELEKRYK
jgi:ferric-dicitrate binding protein FerR (iron transport regulator)/TolA-binding protein